MNRPGLPYRIAASLGVPLVPLLLRDDVARAAHRSRLDAVAQLVAWGKQRDHSRKLAWFHAASVGEGLQAEAVLLAYRKNHPEALVIFTHYSPSAIPLAKRIPADWSGFLPYDRPEDVIPVLEALKPDLLVFSKVDLWPELACQAAGRGVRVALVAATVEPESSRLGWPARAMSRPGYQAVSCAGAISPADADRLVTLGVHRDRIVVTGDPRIDSVFARLEQENPDFIAPIVAKNRTLISGSTWSEDESVLLGAFAEVRRQHPDAVLILVPHQPTTEHMQQLQVSIARHELQGTITTSHLILVERVGVLASLYPCAAMAYVGGGFGTRGIHSVLEPAAAGLPVIIGPNDRGSRDALLLESVDALVRLTESRAVKELTAIWSDWLRSPATVEETGSRGKALLESERGAAERSVEVLEQQLKNRG